MDHATSAAALAACISGYLKRGLAALALGLGLSAIAAPPAWAGFAANFGGQLGAETGVTASASDAAGNQYITGPLPGATLDIGGVTLTRIGAHDGFVAKISSAGTMLWARNFGGGGASLYPTSLAVDGAGGVYLGGYFQGASLTTPALAKIGAADGVAIKLDAATGATAWAENFGGAGAETYPTALAIDGSAVYLGGMFVAGNLTKPALTKLGGYDAMVIKLDAASGATGWAKNFGGPGAGINPNALLADGAGGIYLSGHFLGNNLSTPALSLIGGHDGLLIKLAAADGSTSWAQNFGGSGTLVEPVKPALDGAGGVYFGGYFDGDLTTPALAKLGSQDALAIKLNTVTGATVWAQGIGGAPADMFGLGAAVTLGTLAADSDGVYLTGYFYDADLTAPALAKIGYTDAFAIKLAAADGAASWAKNFGGIGANVIPNGLAVDGSGGLYLGGYHDLNLSTPELSSIGNQDALVIKLDSASGSTVWHKNFGGAGASVIQSPLKIDGAGGVSLTGYFRNSNLSTPPLAKIGQHDGLVIRLDASDGATLWSRSFGGYVFGGNAQITRVALDGANNKYIAGTFDSATFVTGGVTHARRGFQDAFVAKLDPGGSVLWAKSFGGGIANLIPDGLLADGAGGVYLSTQYDDNLAVPALEKIGMRDGLVIKLNASDGATAWTKNFGGSGVSLWLAGLAADGAGGIYLGGHFTDGDLTAPAVTRIGNTDALAIKLDAATGATTWVRNLGGNGADAYATALALDGAGGVYLGGYFSANLTTPALNLLGFQDGFVIKIDAAAGSVQWGKNFGGESAFVFPGALATDGAGGVYFGGHFDNANLSMPPLTNIGVTDGMVVKLAAADGGTAWSRNFGGPDAWAYASALAADSGGVYVGAYFDSAGLTTPALARIGTADGLAIKYDAASGATLWARNVGGSGASIYTYGLALDGAGGVYLNGYFDGASLTAPALAKIGARDGLAVKLDAAAGTIRWAKNFGGAGAQVHPAALAVDGFGGVYLGGYFDGGNLSTPALSKIGVQDAVLWSPTHRLSYDGNGNTGGSAPADSNAYGPGEDVTVRANTGALVKTARAFSGWNTAGDGSGTDYAASGSAHLTMGSSDLTLYAKWTAASPLAATAPASAVGTAGATLNGTVSANGASTTVSFEYGTTTGYGSSAAAAQSPLAGNADNAAVSAAIGGLTCNTLYHFRVNAANGVGGTIHGNDLTFTTAACVPSATTSAAGNVSQSGATLNGLVSANGAETTVSFDYGTSIAYGTRRAAVPATVAANGSSSVSLALNGLACNTTYHFRVSATNAAGTTNGGNQSFSTAACPGTVPGAPAITSATPGAGSASLAFSAPASNGGTPITSYLASCSAPGQVTRSTTAAASPVVVRGMRGGVTYTCTVAAVNGVGAGPWSQPAQVQPRKGVSLAPILMLLMD